MVWAGVVGAVAVAVVMGAVTIPVLGILPEPIPSQGKVPYADLATPRFAGSVALATLLTAFSVVANAPPATWPVWLGLVGPGVLAAVVDARTTYLPKRLCHVSWLLTTVGVILAALTVRSGQPVASAALGALTVGGFFWLLWRFTRGIGFGDVRLMVTVGAVCGVYGPAMVGWAVLAGTSLGAIWGIWHRLVRGPGPFAYGPGLLVGPFVALWIQPLAAI